MSVGRAFFGNCGEGNDWRVGTGAPSLLPGDNEGDLYLDDASGDVYQVQGGVWTLVDNITGPPGLDGSNGADGTPGNLWTTAAGAPVGSGTNVGDLYLNTTNGDYYSWDGATWNLEGNLTGPTGATGAAGVDGNDWRVGSGAPSLIGGDEEGDLYLNTANSDVYQVQSSTWTLVANIAGADGADGEGVPTGGTAGQYLKKDSSTNFDTSWATFSGEACYATSSATDIDVSNWSTVQFNTTGFNVGGFTHDTTTNYSITVPSAGIYLVGANIWVQGGTSGTASDVLSRIRFRVGGNAVQEWHQSAMPNVTTTPTHSIMGVVPMNLSASDELDVQVRRGSGAPQVKTLHDRCEFWVVKIK